MVKLTWEGTTETLLAGVKVAMLTSEGDLMVMSSMRTGRFRKVIVSELPAPPDPGTEPEPDPAPAPRPFPAFFRPSSFVSSPGVPPEDYECIGIARNGNIYYVAEGSTQAIHYSGDTPTFSVSTGVVLFPRGTISVDELKAWAASALG
jgi:hypothetical protein